MGLTMPTILAAALIVFMRAFADFGTPAIIGEGYKTFPVLIYDSFLSEVGADYNFASAVSVLAIILTGLVFLLQKFATSRFKFTINSLHPIQKKEAKGLSGCADAPILLCAHRGGHAAAILHRHRFLPGP